MRPSIVLIAYINISQLNWSRMIIRCCKPPRVFPSCALSISLPPSLPLSLPPSLPISPSLPPPPSLPASLPPYQPPSQPPSLHTTSLLPSLPPHPLSVSLESFNVAFRNVLAYELKYHNVMSLSGISDTSSNSSDTYIHHLYCFHSIPYPASSSISSSLPCITTVSMRK